jgi:hypothetical protein
MSFEDRRCQMKLLTCLGITLSCQMRARIGIVVDSTRGRVNLGLGCLEKASHWGLMGTFLESEGGNPLNSGPFVSLSFYHHFVLAPPFALAPESSATHSYLAFLIPPSAQAAGRTPASGWWNLAIWLRVRLDRFAAYRARPLQVQPYHLTTAPFLRVRRLLPYRPSLLRSTLGSAPYLS